MKKIALLGLLLATFALSIASASSGEPVGFLPADPASEILGLERRVMDAWLHGDPDPFLAICDPDVTYFHVMTEKRVDGLAALKALVEPFRGRSLFDSYEMLEPKVRAAGDTAVLTYVLLRRIGGDSSRWNGTEVFQKKAEGWRLVHEHWSQTASR